MIVLTVNGEKQSFEGDLTMPLNLYLRDVLGIASIRQGCHMGSCKSCLVILDANRCLACCITMAELDNRSVVTAPAW